MNGIKYEFIVKIIRGNSNFSQNNSILRYLTTYIIIMSCIMYIQYVLRTIVFLNLHERAWSFPKRLMMNISIKNKFSFGIIKCKVMRF